MAKPLSRAQREWLKDLGSLVGEAPADVAVEEGVEDDAIEDDAGGKRKGIRRGADDQAFIGGIIPGVPEIESITSRVTIKNASNVALRIVSGSASLENATASFVKAPPVDIPAGPSEVDFSVTNKPSFPVPFPVGGTGGEIKYNIVGDAQKAQLFLKWERGGIAPSRETTQTITPDDGRFKIDGINSGGEDFQFDFALKGTAPPPPGPGPAPPPGPAVDIQASCQITVINETAFVLTRADADHVTGDFMVPPPRTVEPNNVVTFVSVETSGAKEEGCKGFVVYEVAAPTPVVWRVEWDNPEGARNVSSATLTPQTAGFRSQDVIGQGDENVPVSFTLSGGSAGPTPPPPPGPTPPPPPPGPVPPPPPPPGVEVPFVPPVEQKQPTLRKGDKSEDRWVEYAQLLLNHHLGTSLPEDGNFEGTMLAAVQKFQTKEKLLVDGVIGNQTWAALREGAPEKPSTDGRAPHTFVEKGAEARWAKESSDNNRHFKSDDLFRLLVQTVGDTVLDPKAEATLRVTAPGAAPRIVKGTILERPGKFPSHKVEVKNFRKAFPSVPVDAPVTEYLIEAFLPQELGGDFYSAKVQEGSG